MKIGSTLYFDHQASTPVDSRVFEAMRPFFGDRFGNPHSSEHVLGWRAASVVERAATEIGSLIGADGQDILFTSGATEANNIALLGLAAGNANNERNQILIGESEHKCVLEIGWALNTQYGFEVIHIPVENTGLINVETLKSMLTEQVLAVSVMAVNNEIGTIQDIPAISEAVRAVGALFHCDGAQAPCALDVGDFAELTDLLSLSCHKMYGPTGIGALYIAKDVRAQLKPIQYGGGQQGGLKSGTVPTALCVGFGEAARLLQTKDAADERVRIARLRDSFVSGLKTTFPDIWMNGTTAKSTRHPGNANIGFKGVNAAELLGALQPSIAASTGSACSSGIPEASHVLRAIGLSESAAESCIRFSLGRFTSEEDIEEAVKLIGKALENMKAFELMK